MRTPRALAMAIAGAAALMILVWFMFLFRPQGNRISDLQEEVEAARAEEQSLQATLEQLQAIDADRPALEAELRRLTAAVPPQPELAGFILAAHDIAAEAGIDFMSITPAPPTAVEGQAGLGVIAMGISAQGSFFNVLDFLDRMEELERVVVIDALNLTRVPPTPPSAPEAQASALGGGVPLTTDPTTGTTIDPTFGGVILPPGSGGDAGAAGGAAPGVQPGIVAGSLDAQLRGQVASDHTVSVEIQARAFTTAVPAPAADDATPGTQAPADTTTTTAVAGQALGVLGARFRRAA